MISDVVRFKYMYRHIISCMNKTEKKAYRWLLQRYSKEDIIFQRRKNPDFLTTDGKGYEAKRLYGNTIWFTQRQFEEIKNLENVTILVFSDDKDEPILTFPATMLKNGLIIKGVKVSVVKGEEEMKTIQISDEVWETLSLLKIKMRKKTFDEVISELLSNYYIKMTPSKSYIKTPEIPKTLLGIPKRKVVGPSESIERPSEVEEEIPPEEVLSTEEESGKYERVEDEIVEEFLEGRGEPTIGDAIVKILYERAREPKELLKLLIDMGYPPEECEKVLEELVKKGAIEVCEVQIGKYGKKTLLRLKGSK